MRKLIIIIFLPPFFGLSQQVPLIQNITPTSGEVGSTVTITGRSLSGRVFFGTVEATVASSSATLMEVIVPPGAIHAPITILRGNGRVAQSPQEFTPSFSGSDIANFDSEYLVASTETDAYDICLCDLNNDGANDIVIAHNITSNNNSGSEVTIYRNNLNGDKSALATPDFQLTAKLNNNDNVSGYISATCEDLTGDGFPELIFSANSGTSANSIYIYRNTGTFSFNTTRADAGLRIPNLGSGDNRIPRRPKVADVDSDGFNDIVIGNQSDGTIHVFRGNGNLTFENPDEIAVEGAEQTGSIALADLNNDALVDIIAVPFRQSNESIYILKNTSQPDIISFEQENEVPSFAQRTNVATGDFDGDGLIDLVATNSQLGRIAFSRNTTVDDEIAFSNGQTITVSNSAPWGIDVGDLNGDGKPDVAIASDNNSNRLFILENNSSSGTIAFENPVSLATTRNTRNTCIGDLNGDAKPDIVFTHNVSQNQAGNLGVFINRNCVEPTLSPNETDGTLCDSPESFTLTATNSPGATYNWEVETGVNTNANGNSFSTSTNTADFQLANGTTSSTISVTITSEDGFCTTEFARQTYQISGNVTPTPAISLSETGPFCAGDDLTLSSTTTSDNYFWTTPDGQTITTTSLSLTGLEVSDAGTYTLITQNTGACVSEVASIEVEVLQVPLFTIANSGDDNFCSNTTVSLSVADRSADFDYQWKRDGVNIAGATSPSFEASIDGSYSVELTDANNCNSETETYAINAVTVPTAAFTGANETCQNAEVIFSNTSTGDAGFNLEYAWSVRDGSNTEVFSATTPNLVYDFPVAVGDYTVNLTTSYAADQVAACSASTSSSITVATAPTIDFNINNNVQKCPADSLEVILSAPLASTIDSYSWKILNPTTNEEVDGFGATSESFFAKSPAGFSSIKVAAEITTTIGCVVSDTVTIENFDSDLSITTGLPTTITTIDAIDFTTVTLEEDNFLNVSVAGAAATSEYSWEPVSKFQDPTAASTIFFPSQPSEIITLTATDLNGCNSAFSLLVVLDNLRPRKTFSPNGDGTNDCWEILNIGDLGTNAGCKVFVFDSRGRNILELDQFSNGNCVWDGSFNGSQVPEGVYYYALQCENTSQSTTGSILLAR